MNVLPREMIQQFREARRTADESPLLDDLSTLIRYGWDVDALDAAARTPMMWAGSMGLYKVVQRLLNAGANPERTDNRGWSALRYVLMRPSPIPNDVLERLITPRTMAPTLPFGWTALMMGARNGSLRTIERCIEYGTDVRHRSTTGKWDAMQLAARNGHKECLQRLYAAGGCLSQLRCIHPTCRPLVIELKREIKRLRKERQELLMHARPSVPHEVCDLIVNFVYEHCVHSESA